MADDVASRSEDGVSDPFGPRKWVRWLKHLVGLVIIAGFIAYPWFHRDELAVALDVSLWHFTILCLLIGVSWLVNGIQAHVIYRAVNLPVSVWEGTLLTAAGTFGNYLPMRAGTVVRALYLKNVHGLRLARFGGITGLRILLTVIAAGVMGIIGLGVILLRGATSIPYELTGIFVALVLFPVIVMLIPPVGYSWLPGRLGKIAADFSDAYDELRRQPAVALQVVVLLLIQYLVLGIRFAVSADAVSAEIESSFLLLMAPLAALMSFAAFTPGGLGLREAVMGFVTLSIGFSFSEGVFVGTVDRAVLLIMVAVFGGFAFRTLWRRLG